MLELRKEITRGLKQSTGLNVYLPYQEIAGLHFPLITLEMQVSDGRQNLNHETLTYTVRFDVYLYSEDVEELFTHGESIREYFKTQGLKCIYESQPSKSHHWYRQYQFECVIQVRNENYIIL
jgi:hypothetical protein